MKIDTFSGLKNVVAVVLMVSIFLTSSMVVLAGTEAHTLSAEITFSDNLRAGENSPVKLNGEAVVSGRTFFSGGEISTSDKSDATISLGKLGSLKLAPNTTLNLEFAESRISGTVSAGSVEVFSGENVQVNIETVGSAAVKSAKQSGQGGPGGGVLIPVLIFAAIVGGVVIYTLTNDDDDGVVSPVR